MKKIQSTLLALTLIIMVSSTALAGNIGGLRSAGNIGGTRSAGNIGGMRSAGNIGGMRSTNAPQIIVPRSSRFDLEGSFSEAFTGLIRMLVESGALL